MAYTNATIDLTKPADTDLASSGDDEIRRLKLDLKERLESFFVSLDGDPLVAKDGAINFPVDGAEVGIGVAAARPAVTGTVQMYYAVDSEVLSFNNGAAWVEYDMSLIVAAPPDQVIGKGVNYNPGLSAGNRVTSVVNILKRHSVVIVGTGPGLCVVTFEELIAAGVQVSAANLARVYCQPMYANADDSYPYHYYPELYYVDSVLTGIQIHTYSVVNAIADNHGDQIAGDHFYNVILFLETIS